MVQLLSADSDAVTARADARGNFQFDSAPGGEYVIMIEAPGYRRAAGTTKLSRARKPQGPIQVLTVCEALDGRDRYDGQQVVIVGIFKSGLEETLRQDCPAQLATGGIGWLDAVALPHSPSLAGSSPVLEQSDIKKQIEQKKAQIRSSDPPPRPERVMALHGFLDAPSGFTSVACPACADLQQMDRAPVRLLDRPHL